MNTSQLLRRPGILLGVGLGGFLDGILLHQVLQWHHLLTGEEGGELSDTVAGLEANTLADGFFHLATWILVVAAMALTVRAWQRGELAPRSAGTWRFSHSACCSWPSGWLSPAPWITRPGRCAPAARRWRPAGAASS